MIVTGIVLLSASLKSTLIIYKKSENSAWAFLLVSIILFIIGYLLILFRLSPSEYQPFLVIIICCILCGGGGFVFLVSKLSYNSIVKIERAVEEQRYQAEHDMLTGLPNRKMFFKSLSHAIKNNNPCCVFFIDLNDFKQVNDSFGHHCGDQLLISIAQKLQQNLPSLGTLFRIGGDEFAIHFIQRKQSDFERCVKLIKKITTKPLFIDKQYITVNFSVGISRYPQDSQQIDELVKYADVAMYEAKKSHKQVVSYSLELGKKADNTLLMASDIKKAIKENEFELYYQPIVSSNEVNLHGAEVLIRWPQRDGSFIPPDQFVPIAEQSNTILELTKWVIVEALVNLKTLKVNGFSGLLHINLSAQDLKSDAFYEFLIALYEQDPSISQDIIFEITESAMMTNIVKVQKIISRLHSKGFKFSVDDFGTGFSSLLLLRDLLISELKIDRSFVMSMLDKPSDMAIVKSIIFLAKELGCNVVAEGIENKQVEKTLVDLQCPCLQGFYYSKPLNLEAFKSKYLV